MSLSFPTPLDAQLFQAVSQNTSPDQVLECLHKGARVDVLFHLNYEILREHTTRVSLTALEGLLMGWEWGNLLPVLQKIGPLPPMVLPNAASAVHALYRLTDKWHLGSDYPPNQRMFAQNITNIKYAIRMVREPCALLTPWEVIACKDFDFNLNNHPDIPLLVETLSNWPKISTPEELAFLERFQTIFPLPLGALACIKIGVGEHLWETPAYQKLLKRIAMDSHPQVAQMDQQINACILERAVAPFANRPTLVRKI